MKANLDRTSNPIAEYNGITLTSCSGQPDQNFSEGWHGYYVETPEEITCFEADASRGRESMRRAYEKAALFFNDLVPFDTSIPLF